jgi:succinate-semialdehyde dehydrogenase/glutarate-semialdehyde dehydrogenase
MNDLPQSGFKLSRPDLQRHAGLIGGEWRVTAKSNRWIDVDNPASRAVIGRVPDFAVDEIREAIDAADKAQKLWRNETAATRSTVMRRWYDSIIAHCEDLAAILTAELGKPIGESRGEVRYGAGYVQWYGEEAKRAYGDVLPPHRADARILVLKEPVGVVAAITPWNFPSAMFARKVAPAIAAGCAVVFKPAEQTPFSALALSVLAEEAGVPPGLISVIPTSDAQQFGEEVCRNDRVRKLTFTGSTPVGRHLMALSSQKLLRLSMELGGNAPFIVFEDADIDAAVEGAIVSKFRNAGQTCVCANRIYVEASVYDRFAEKLAARVRGLKVGDGFDDGVDIGPLVDENAVAKVRAHIDDALHSGAEQITGDGDCDLGPNYVMPTVLTGMSAEMRIAHEETFGPVAPLFRFSSTDEVIELANATEYGLAAYFYANDLARVWRVVEALEYGMVGINTGLISTEVAPFGGIKQSGFGREGSRYGLEDFLQLKYACFGAIDGA